MPYPKRELTDAEREQFMTDNNDGVLCFSGDEPYGVPMGFMYKKGTVLIGFSKSGRKLEYIQKSPKVCFTIYRPRRNTPDLKESCTSVILEGKLEEVTDLTYYGLEKEIPKVPEHLILFSIKVDKLGTKKCLQQPCEILAKREAS